MERSDHLQAPTQQPVAHHAHPGERVPDAFYTKAVERQRGTPAGGGAKTHEASSTVVYKMWYRSYTGLLSGSEAPLQQEGNKHTKHAVLQFINVQYGSYTTAQHPCSRRSKIKEQGAR